MGTDAAWRWREGVEDKYHYRFWGQVARWMAYQRGIASGEKMRLFYSPDNPLTEVSLADLKQIYGEGGTTDAWEQVSNWPAANAVH